MADRLGRCRTGFDNEDWVTFLHRNVAETIEAAAA
jgi:hypothetical protein